jgi:hypothetical protein
MHKVNRVVSVDPKKLKKGVVKKRITRVVTGKAKIPQGFFTTSTFGTLMGCAMVVWFVSGVISGVFNIPPKIIGFLMSIVVAYVGLFLSEEREKVQYIIAFFNGCVIYTMVVGGTSFTPYLNNKTAGVVAEKEVNFQTALMRPWIADKNLAAVTKLLAQDKADQAAELAKVEEELKGLQDELAGSSVSPAFRNRLVMRLDATEKSIIDTKSKVEVRSELLKDMGVGVFSP